MCPWRCLELVVTSPPPRMQTRNSELICCPETQNKGKCKGEAHSPYGKPSWPHPGVRSLCSLTTVVPNVDKEGFTNIETSRASSIASPLVPFWVPLGNVATFFKVHTGKETLNKPVFQRQENLYVRKQKHNNILEGETIKRNGF